MKIIEPKVCLWQQTDPIAHVARCARVCYGNAVSKGEEADKRLYENLKKSGHLSMFRHESVYAIIPDNDPWIINFWPAADCPFISLKNDNRGKLYVATNKNYMIDRPTLNEFISKYQVFPEEFANTETGRQLMRYTFHITTQISTSRELNRVSPNNIAERSTRYVNESDGVICRPHWISKEAVPSNENNSEEIKSYYNFCNLSFVMYKQLLEHNIKREDARGILPLDTATEVVYTYSVKEWKHIIELRSDKRAHPNCQIIANMIKEQLEQLGYDFK